MRMGRETTIAYPVAARHPRRLARDRGAHDTDRQHRAPLLSYVLRGDILTLATAPVIYSLVVPFVVMDLWVSLYQAVCFRAWGVRRVRRRAYFAIDRHKLGYLNGIEKANCVYCSYVNGLVAYVREVAARTEPAGVDAEAERNCLISSSLKASIALAATVESAGL